MNEAMQAIEAISAVGGAVESGATADVSKPTGNFGQWFVSELNSVNAQLVTSERNVQELAAGGTASVHDTMIQLEQARMQFQLAIQVRGRMLEAYQEIMRMQV